jgi:hypothetical protein
VPTISRFFGITIAMFFDDHGPPHFHARHAAGSALNLAGGSWYITIARSAAHQA